MFRPRRLAAVLAAGALFSAGGAVWLHDGNDAAEAEESAPAVPQPVVTTTTVTLPPETTAPPPVRTAVRAPSNPYADEPIVKIGTVEIPKIGLVHEIYHGITMRNINLGPSHWPGTAFPGEVGNSVFAGHRVTKTHPFRNIDKLAPGDQVIFSVNGVRSVYAVSGSLIVKPTQLEIVNHTPGPTMTLFACHPPGSARYRYVVHLAYAGVV
jgi:sortase A